jgi:hypothetical protein
MSVSRKPPRKNWQAPLTLPRASAADLRGRQSTRVAFKLSPNCIEAMNILGSHLRLKPKSLFDHMVQERRVLEAIAAKAGTSSLEDAPRAAKTYVISRDAAEILEEVARAHQLPRDLLVEASVQHLMPLIEKEQRRHGARKTLLAKMERHLKGGRQLLAAMTAELGPNDPMRDKMNQVMGTYERAYAAMADFVQKGDIIEGFDTET